MDVLFSKWLALAKKSSRGFTPDSVQLAYEGLKQRIVSHQMTEEQALKYMSYWYKSDIMDYLGQDLESLAIKSDIQSMTNGKKNYFFITVGFDDKIITIPSIRKCIKSLGEMKDINLYSIVAEKYRKDNEGKIYEHHHIHLLVKTDYPKSKVIQYTFQKVAKFVQGKNFIDVKNEQTFEHYEKYINGDKKIEKLECVEMDKKWRLKNNL